MGCYYRTGSTDDLIFSKLNRKIDRKQAFLAVVLLFWLRFNNFLTTKLLFQKGKMEENGKIYQYLALEHLLKSSDNVILSPK